MKMIKMIKKTKKYQNGLYKTAENLPWTIYLDHLDRLDLILYI